MAVTSRKVQRATAQAQSPRKSRAKNAKISAGAKTLEPKTAVRKKLGPVLPPTQDAILEDYAGNTLTIDQIAAKHGVSSGYVTLLARERNVPRRSTRCGARMKPLSRGGAPGVGQVLSEAQMADMFRPFYRLVWRKLPAMEERMSKPASAADDERDSKTLARWIETLEKMNEVATAVRKAAKKTKDPAVQAAAQDMDRMRREIAERLERLHNKRAAARSACRDPG